ncbi:hypothetical protein JCM8547_000862 [Rhodosporidiobolus lusitaniae]
MGRTATVHFVPLRNCLCNLPLSLHAPLAQRGVAPQSLAVHLSFRSTSSNAPHSIYLGWTGLPASVPPVQINQRGNAPSHDRIEIDPQFANMLNVGLAEGMLVNIELLRELPSASTVNVTPLSADDWEILETNAEFVEMFLLNQVRAVKDGMVVGCWVGGTNLVRFVVDSVSPPASPTLLLTSSTELIVAPKTRHAPAPASSKLHDLATPSSTSTSTPASSHSEWAQTARQLLRLLPLELAPSELTTAPENERPGEDALLVSPDLARRVRRAFPLGKITLSWFARPASAEAGGKKGGQDGAAPAGAEEGTAGGSAAAGEGAARPVMADVRVYESAAVASGHAWIGEEVRREIGFKGSEGEFELLRIAAPLSSQAKKARAKEQQAAASPAASTTTSPRMNGTLRPSMHQNLPPPSRSSQQQQPNGLSSSPSKPLPSLSSLPSTSSYSSLPVLAGIDTQLAALESHIVNSLAARTLARPGKGESAPGVLVTGASGAGKTALVKAMAKAMERDSRVLAHTIYVDCAKHADERLPVLKGRFKDWFDEACWHAPSVLVLDNLDRMLAAEVEHADSFPAVHLANTFLSLALPALASRPVILIATAQGSTSLHPLLTTTHLLGETVSLRGPNKTARRDILSALIAAKTSSSSSSSPDQPQQNTLTASSSLNPASVAAITEGYLPADLRDLVDRAVHQAAIRTMRDGESTLSLTPDDFHVAQSGFIPLSLRDVKLQKSEVQWADIGGLHEARKTLRETLEWPTKYGAIFAGCPLRLRSGLLLYGYPGCGKTLLASAVAKECGLNFISVKGPEILNKYIGASEKSVRDLFDCAQAAKPCILFFDEFDSIAPKRGHDSTGVTDRVVNQMLTQMDGAEGLDGVYVLAATSRPDLIDPALLRPGRLDKSILCDMPSASDRLEIMRSAARKIHLSPSVDLSTLASQTAGYSGADLQAVIYNAHLDAIHAQLSASEEAEKEEGEGKENRRRGGGNGEEGEVKYVAIGGEEGEKVLSRAEQASVNKRLELILGAMKEQQRQAAKAKKPAAATATPASRAPTYVEDHHLQKSLSSTRPSVPAEELARLRRIYNEFVSGRSANGLPSGEATDEIGGRATLM